MSAFVGVYWGQRKESRSSAALRLHRFFEQISKIDPRLQEWFLQAMTEKAARTTKVELTVKSLQRRLRTDRTDLGRGVIEELGFGFGAWNGADASFSCTLGCFSERVGNSVLLMFDYIAMNVDVEFARAVLVAAVDAFEPELGRVGEFAADSSPCPEWLAYDRIHGIRAASLAQVAGPRSRRGR